MVAERKLFEIIDAGRLLHLQFHGHDFKLAVAQNEGEIQKYRDLIKKDLKNSNIIDIPINGDHIVMTAEGMIVHKDGNGEFKPKISESWKNGHKSLARYAAESKGTNPNIYVQIIGPFGDTSEHYHTEPEHYLWRWGEALVQNGKNFDTKLNQGNPYIVKEANSGHILKTVGNQLIAVIICEDDNHIRSRHLPAPE